jgi:hypothetical protein
VKIDQVVDGFGRFLGMACRLNEPALYGERRIERD